MTYWTERNGQIANNATEAMSEGAYIINADDIRSAETALDAILHFAAKPHLPDAAIVELVRILSERASKFTKPFAGSGLHAI